MKSAPQIPEYARSGSAWEKFTFDAFASNWEMRGEPYKVDVLEILFQLLRGFSKKFGLVKGVSLMLKSLVWDMVFNQPAWMPEKFNIRNQTQAAFYRTKFNEYKIFFVLFNNLKKVLKTEEADHFLAEQILPIILDMMAARFYPVADIDSVEVWLKQARGYLGEEIEEGKGFEGDIYLATDRSEMRFHVTRCATVQLIREYGLRFSAAAFCMADHITYHTFFPNLIFKRSHSLSVGDAFCDHEFRLRTKSDAMMSEENYGDCARVEGMRDLVSKWEDKAKEMYFGDQDKWMDYAGNYFSTCDE